MSLVVLHHLAVLRSVVRPNSGQPSNAALVDVIPCLPNQAHAVGYRRPRVLTTDRQAPVDGGTESRRLAAGCSQPTSRSSLSTSPAGSLGWRWTPHAGPGDSPSSWLGAGTGSSAS